MYSNFKIKGIFTKTGEEDLVECPVSSIYLYENPGKPKYDFTEEDLESQTLTMT